MKLSVGTFNHASHLFRLKSGAFLKKNGSTIRTTGICIGVVWTAIEAVKATPAACMAYEDAKTWCEENGVEFSIIRKLEACGKYYIKPVVIGGATIGLAIYNERANLKAVAGLTAALKEADKMHREFVEAVTEDLGPKKKAEIEEKIANNECAKNPPPIDQSGIILTGFGNELFYDAFGTGRYYRSSLPAMQMHEAEFRLRLEHEDYLSLNDWYDTINLPDTELGEELGWCASAGDEFRVRYIGVVPLSGPETYTKVTFEEGYRPKFDYHYATGDYGRYR